MKKVIGIIGGMGPMAALDLHAKITTNTAARTDRDHLHVILNNDPQVPDRSAAILSGGESPVPAIVRSGRLLEAAGAQLLVMSCNTAHHYLDEIQAALSAPLLSMVAVTAEACADVAAGAAGLLATEGAARAGTYAAALAARGVRLLLPPDGMGVVMEYVYAYKAGRSLDPAPLFALADDLFDCGAEAVILGCTELPMLFESYSGSAALIDPTLLLARRAILEAGGTLIDL